MPDQQIDDPLFTRQEAEASLNITTRHMRHLVDDRRIRFTKSGKLLRFRKSWLDDHLRENERAPVKVKLVRVEPTPTSTASSGSKGKPRRTRKAAA
jgi:excisionase family DNA binding protein